jgi:hypothetical protein
MSATVIAERIGWPYSIRMLSGRVAELRPVCLPPDPASRTSYVAGEIVQCEFWFPDIALPVGFCQTRTAKQLPVLTMVTGHARWTRRCQSRAVTPPTCSPAGGSRSPRWALSRGCWSGMARARSADGAAPAANSPSSVRDPAARWRPRW